MKSLHNFLVNNHVQKDDNEELYTIATSLDDMENNPYVVYAKIPVEVSYKKHYMYVCIMPNNVIKDAKVYVLFGANTGYESVMCKTFYSTSNFKKFLNISKKELECLQSIKKFILDNELDKACRDEWVGAIVDNGTSFKPDKRKIR